MNNPKSSPAIIFVIGLALTAALGLVSIHVPFARDQGASAYVAWIMEHGGVVYRDVFHFNLPATYFAYLLALKLPLSLPESVNLMQVAVNVACVAVVFPAARRVTGPVAAAVAAVLFGVFMSVLYTDYWDMAEKESLACLPLAVALYGFIRMVKDDGDEAGDSRVFAWAALAGAMTGVAAQFKPTLGIVLAAGLYGPWQRRRTPVRAGLLAAACGAGFAVSFLPLAWYVISNQTWDSMYDFIFRFGGFYGGQQYEPGIWKAFTGAVWEIGRWLYRWRALAVLAAFWPRRGERVSAAGRVTVLFGALLLVQVVVQGKYFTYHFIPVLIPFAIAAAAGGREIFRRAADASGSARYALAALIALAILDNLEPESSRYYRHLLYDFGRTDRVSFLKPYGRWGEGDINPLASELVAKYIREHSEKRDTIQIIGHESGIYVMAGRPAAARFHFDQPYMTDPKGNQAFTEYRARMRAEVIQSLSTRKPVYIVVIEDDATGVEPEDSVTQVKTFPELSDLIESDYTLETKIEDFYLYRLSERVK